MKIVRKMGGRKCSHKNDGRDKWRAGERKKDQKEQGQD